MSTSHHARRRAPLVLLCLAALSAATGVAVSLARSPLANAAPGTRAALLLFIAVAPGQGAPLPLAELRAEANWLLADACAARGAEIAPAGEVEALQRRWRVRGPLAFPREFVAEAAQRLGVERLIAAQILVYPGRLVLAARALDTATGHVAWAEAGEARLADAPTDTATWLAALRLAAARLDDAWRGDAPVAAGASPLHLLPARTVGLEPLDGEAATICLLRACLARGDWRLTDPALLVAALQERGGGSAALDTAGCAALRAAFGPGLVVVPEVMAWDATPTASAIAAPEEPGGALRPGLPSFVLALHAIDSRTGLLRGRAEVYRDAAEPLGWFGARRSASPLDRYQTAATRLLAAAHLAPEEDS